MPVFTSFITADVMSSIRVFSVSCLYNYCFTRLTASHSCWSGCSSSI